MILIKGANNMKKKTRDALITALKCAEKHVIQEGSREHVVSYSKEHGAVCSCENCEINVKH